MITFQEIEAKTLAAFDAVAEGLAKNPTAQKLANEAKAALATMRNEAVNAAKQAIAEFATARLTPILANGAATKGGEAASNAVADHAVSTLSLSAEEVQPIAEPETPVPPVEPNAPVAPKGGK